MENKDLIVETEYGRIEGVDSPLCIHVFGIPYAKPPLGELRFRHPRKPEPWQGVLPCKKPKNNAMQAPAKFEYKDTVSPDCLYLNVYVPHDLKGKAPVMVWIHGGAYETGGVGATNVEGVPIHYDLSTFANETNTVAVTIAYRLNVEGFMNLHDLSPRFDSNNGLYDIKMALEFVRDNIAAFGGDPSNVTLFGESAGGALTLAMLASDLTCGLFQRAIVQSACVDHFWSRKKSAKIAKRFLRYCHIRKADELLDLPWEVLREGMRKTSKHVMLSGNITSPYSPVIDEVFLKQMPREGVLKRKHPLMIGTITHEADLFVVDLSSTLLHAMTIMTPVRAKKGDLPYRLRVADGLTEFVFREPSEYIASNYGGVCHMFELDCMTPEMKAMGCRSMHSADLMPLFHFSCGFAQADDPDVYVVGKMMRPIWSDFAYGRLDEEPYLPGKKKIIINPDIARELTENRT